MGRKKSTTEEFRAVSRKDRGKGPARLRRVVRPFLTKAEISKLVNSENVAHFNGMLVTVLEKHLEAYMNDEAGELKKHLQSVYRSESLQSLIDRNIINTLKQTQQHCTPQLESLHKCVAVSKGKPLIVLGNV